MILDGKIAGQHYKGGVSGKVRCGKCYRLIDRPETDSIEYDGNVQIVRHYLSLPYFIYETKLGFSICYCSDKCRRKHNHRFNQRVIDNTDKAMMVTQRFWNNLKVGDIVRDTIYNKNATVLSVDGINVQVTVPEEMINTDIITDGGFRRLWEIDFPKRGLK
jgi:hypothetical protein